MTQKIYRPDGAGGLLQIKDGSKWLPIFGVQSISSSGGDRETSEFETLDGGVESTFGGAGVKDINMTLNPSFMGAQWRKLVNNAYYGNDTVTIRYRTLANVSDVAKGAAGHGVSIKAITEGLGNEGELTFEGSDGASLVAKNAAEEVNELGLLITGTDTAIAAGDRTEEEPVKEKFFILRLDDSDKIQASEWNGRGLKTAVTTKDGWVLIRYGIAVEYTCRVTTAGNPDFATGSAIGETLNFRQVSSGMKIYPITKAAS